MPGLSYLDPTTGEWLPVPTVGPQGPTGATGTTGATGATGPEGPTTVSSDPENLASIGSDSLIHVSGWGRWQGTQDEYDALGTYDENTLYAIIEG